MKKQVIVVILTALFVGMGAVQSVQAQSRKKLKEEIAKLQQENVRLSQDLTTAEAAVEQLQQENQRYAEQNAAMSAQVTQLQQDNLALSQQYQTVLKDCQNAPGAGTGATAGGGSATAPPTGGGVAPSGDSRKCAYYQNKLTPNTSYTEYFNVLQSSGYGIQVFSSKSLCQAAEFAEKFKKNYNYNGYKTYLRCKQVGGAQMYAVVYASLREKSQASTYLRNLKSKDRKTFGGSFIVQH
ncbi:MAG: hypothetical protein AB8F95_09520 [Bacteroidia bacterium]